MHGARLGRERPNRMSGLNAVGFLAGIGESHDVGGLQSHRARDVLCRLFASFGPARSWVAIFLILVALCPSAQGQSSVTVAWVASPDPRVIGYNAYYGPASSVYTNRLSVGNVTSATISELTKGATYFFAVTAYDSSGLESVPSNEVSYQVPDTTNPAPIVALTSPSNGSSYTAPATINCAASVTTNGHTISQVQFYNGTTLLGKVASEPYNWTWDNVSAGNYSLTALVAYDSGITVTSASVNITVTGLPAPWQTADIGSVGVAGSASMSGGIFTVNGAGNITGTTDNFRFVYQILSDNGEIRARLNSIESTGSTGCIGVMIRESLTRGSKYAFMGVSPDGTFRWQQRSSTSSSTATTTSDTGIPPNAWVRLLRRGNMLYGFKSTDGVTWTLANLRSISMAATIEIGLAVASGNSTTLNTSTFSNVTVVP
jgi:hypothetical protein